MVKSLLADAKRGSVRHQYLIQHYAGSGKSNSVIWLAHQLVTLDNDGKELFDTIIVVTDRINLDRQIKNTIRQFMKVSSIVGWTKSSGNVYEDEEDKLNTMCAVGKTFCFLNLLIPNYHPLREKI